MRKIVVLAHVSLDGFMAGPGGNMSFIVDDEESRSHVSALLETVDTAIYGRATYEMVAAYWPTVLQDPAASSADRRHARWVEDVRKVVFSKTLPAPSWNNARVVREDLPGELGRLRRAAGRDIMVFGSASVVQALADHDLVDEWRLNVNPSVLGSGLSFFAGLEEKVSLELRASRTFESGVIACHYVTKRTAKRAIGMGRRFVSTPSLPTSSLTWG